LRDFDGEVGSPALFEAASGRRNLVLADWQVQDDIGFRLVRDRFKDQARREIPGRNFNTPNGRALGIRNRPGDGS
jgi:hypothetical protein